MAERRPVLIRAWVNKNTPSRFVLEIHYDDGSMLDFVCEVTPEYRLCLAVE